MLFLSFKPWLFAWKRGTNTACWVVLFWKLLAEQRWLKSVKMKTGARWKTRDENEIRYEIQRKRQTDKLGSWHGKHTTWSLQHPEALPLGNSQLAPAPLHPCFKVFLGLKSWNWKYWLLCNGHFGLWPLCQPWSGAFHFDSRLHDGACKATALLQQGEACLGEGRRGLLSPGWRPSGRYTWSTEKKITLWGKDENNVVVYCVMCVARDNFVFVFDSDALSVSLSLSHTHTHIKNTQVRSIKCQCIKKFSWLMTDNEEEHKQTSFPTQL